MKTSLFAPAVLFGLCTAKRSPQVQFEQFFNDDCAGTAPTSSALTGDSCIGFETLPFKSIKLSTITACPVAGQSIRVGIADREENCSYFKPEEIFGSDGKCIRNNLTNFNPRYVKVTCV